MDQSDLLKAYGGEPYSYANAVLHLQREARECTRRDSSPWHSVLLLLL